MHIRCPHCHNPIEVVNKDPLAEIDCPSCRSSFGLVGDASTATLLADNQDGEADPAETISYKDSSQKTIAHFTLIDELGMGAFGSVYKAHDLELNRTVA